MNEARDVIATSKPKPPRPWIGLSIALAVVLLAGNLIAYLVFVRGKDSSHPAQPTLDEDAPEGAAGGTVRQLALERRDKALEALREEDYQRAIINLEAAQQLDPTLTELSKFLE